MNPTQIVCPHCHRTNRVPAARLQEHPVCGACKNPLFGVGPVDVPAEAMLKHVQNSDIPVVVDCWAAWCGPCRMMGPEFHKAADAMDTKVRFLKLDTEANQALSGQLGIRSIPCTAMVRKSRVRRAPCRRRRFKAGFSRQPGKAVSGLLLLASL